MKKRILLGIDRDGTLIHQSDYFGRNRNWKKNILFNENVIHFISYLDTIHKTTNIVLSNQSGVAKGYFDSKRVEQINNHINTYFKSLGIKIDNWQYCPDVDSAYSEKHPEIKFDPVHVKTQTKRKPAPDMLFEGLKELKLNIHQFESIVILGDRTEDKELANNINGEYLDVKNKSDKELLYAFRRLIS